MTLVIFQRSLLNYFLIIKKIGLNINLLQKKQAWWSIHSWLVAFHSSSMAGQSDGPQTVWWFWPKHLFGCMPVDWTSDSMTSLT